MHLTGSRSALYNTKHGQDAAQAARAAEAALGAWALPAYNVQRAAEAAVAVAEVEAEAAAPLDDL